MKERSFDEMIAFFNRRVSEMDISQDCKMELLGMVTALGYKHEKSVPQWIPCSERLPSEDGEYLVTRYAGYLPKKIIIDIAIYCRIRREWQKAYPVIAWMPLPESYKGEKE